MEVRKEKFSRELYVGHYLKSNEFSELQKRVLGKCCNISDLILIWFTHCLEKLDHGYDLMSHYDESL